MFLTHVKPQNIFHVGYNFKHKNEVIKSTLDKNLRNYKMDCMPQQQRSRMLQQRLKIPLAAAKAWHSQINK